MEGEGSKDSSRSKHLLSKFDAKSNFDGVDSTWMKSYAITDKFFSAGMVNDWYLSSILGLFFGQSFIPENPIINTGQIVSY